MREAWSFTNERIPPERPEKGGDASRQWIHKSRVAEVKLPGKEIATLVTRFAKRERSRMERFLLWFGNRLRLR